MANKRKFVTEEERKARAEDRTLCRKHDGKDWWCTEEAKYGCFCKKHYFQQQEQARIRAERRKSQKTSNNSSPTDTSRRIKIKSAGSDAVGSAVPVSMRNNIVANSSATARRKVAGRKNTVAGSSQTVRNFIERNFVDSDAAACPRNQDVDDFADDESGPSWLRICNPYQRPYTYVLDESGQFVRMFNKHGVLVGRRRPPTLEDKDPKRTQSDSSCTWTDPLVFPSDKIDKDIEDNDEVSSRFVLQRRNDNPFKGAYMPFEVMQHDSEDQREDSDSLI